MECTLTVIVPVYNAIPYLGECVHSIMMQLWDGCALILVDDGSDDGSETLCLKYAAAHPEKIRTIRTPHIGQSGARNAAIDLVTTDFIAFCDADDSYLPEALSTMAGILCSRPDCDIVVGQYTRVKIAKPQVPHLSISTPEAAVINTLYQKSGYHNSVWATMYRSSLFEDIRFIEGRYYEDLEITPRLYLKARAIMYIDAPVYYYRPNPASFINTWTPSRTDALFATQSILTYVSEHCPRAVPAARSRLFSATFNMFNLAVQHRQPELAGQCWDLITALRRSMLTDRMVRMKNKTGAALSYIGKAACMRLIETVNRCVGSC